MSTRPKPRPKPRPRPRAVAALPPSSSPVLSSSTSLPPTKVVINYDPDEEEDSLFVRNATRTAKTWRKLDEMDKGLL